MGRRIWVMNINKAERQEVRWWIQDKGGRENVMIG